MNCLIASCDNQSVFNIIFVSLVLWVVFYYGVIYRLVFGIPLFHSDVETKVINILSSNLDKFEEIYYGESEYGDCVCFNYNGDYYDISRNGPTLTLTRNNKFVLIDSQYGSLGGVFNNLQKIGRAKNYKNSEAFKIAQEN